MHIGYARVSTQDQDMRLQYEALYQVPEPPQEFRRPVNVSHAALHDRLISS